MLLSFHSAAFDTLDSGQLPDAAFSFHLMDSPRCCHVKCTLNVYCFTAHMGGSQV